MMKIKGWIDELNVDVEPLDTEFFELDVHVTVRSAVQVFSKMVYTDLYEVVTETIIKHVRDTVFNISNDNLNRVDALVGPNGLSASISREVLERLGMQVTVKGITWMYGVPDTHFFEVTVDQDFRPLTSGEQLLKLLGEVFPQDQTPTG